MMNIKFTSRYKASDLVLYEALATREWPEIELPLDTAKSPILAIREDAVVAGLSFVRHPHPSQNKMSLWINSLLVLPDWRRKGVGSALVHSAMQAVPPDTELFVLTEVPNLYLKLSWLLIESRKDGKVLRYCV